MPRTVKTVRGFINHLCGLDAGSVMELQVLNCVLAHLVLEDLACGIHGECVHEADIAGSLVLCHVAADELLDARLVDGSALLEDNAGHDLLAIVRIGYADDLNVGNLGVGVDEVLYFLGIDVLTAADYHILDTARDLEVAVGQAAQQVAGMEPAVLVDGGGGGLGHLIVALHNVVAAGNAVWNFLAGLGVDYLALNAEEGAADGIYAHFERVGGLGHGAAGGSLGLTVNDADLGHVHLVYNVLHDLDGAGRAGHDTGAHMAEIGLIEVGVLQHGDKHGGNAVEAGYLLLSDALEALGGRECGNGAHGSAVGHAGGHGKNHTEAVEHGNLNHHAVGGGKVETVADGLAVVYNVIVGEHNTLGEAGGAGGILHIADIVLADGGGAAVMSQMTHI